MMASATNSERLDPSNGIAACPTHDTAFDAGLIWVNGGQRIHFAVQLTAASRADPATNASFGRPPIAARLILPPGAEPPGGRYLDWHQQHIAAV